MYLVAKLFFDNNKIAKRRESLTFLLFLDNEDNENFEVASKNTHHKAKQYIK